MMPTGMMKAVFASSQYHRAVSPLGSGLATVEVHMKKCKTLPMWVKELVVLNVLEP